MAKGKFPFALFEKSAKDKEKGAGKEGSKKEEAFDKKQKFAKGGAVDGIAQRGKTVGKTVGKTIVMKKGGKC